MSMGPSLKKLKPRSAVSNCSSSGEGRTCVWGSGQYKGYIGALVHAQVNWAVPQGAEATLCGVQLQHNRRRM